MTNLQSGLLDRTRVVSNLLMLVLVAGNIFFSVQYTASIQQQAQASQRDDGQRLRIARFLKLFIDSVLNAGREVTSDQRIALEADVRAIGDADVLRGWNSFVDSADAKSAQERAVKLMALLTNKLI